MTQYNYLKASYDEIPMKHGRVVHRWIGLNLLSTLWSEDFIILPVDGATFSGITASVGHTNIYDWFIIYNDIHLFSFSDIHFKIKS